MTTSSWKRVARIEELSGPGPHAVSAGDVDLVVVARGETFKAYEGRCPHRGALLGEGELHEDVLVCRNHRWRFDVATGQRQGGAECLKSCPTRRDGGDLFVDVSALSKAKRTERVGRRRLEDLPGPARLPLIGSAHLLDPARLHHQLEAWGRSYGTPYRYGFGPKDVVVFSEMKDMMTVLRERPETFRRGSNVEPIFRELGVAGVFSAEGSAWRPQRRLSMEALSHRHLRGFYPTLAQVAERLRRRWQKAAEAGTVLELPEELKRFTVDVTTQLVFGYDIDTIGKDDDVIQEKLGLLFPTFNRRIFSVVPWWRLFRLPKDRAVDRAVAELRTWLRELVAEARERLAREPSRKSAPTNFLEAMLVAKDEAGESFDDETIFGNAMTMLLAGEDTTANTIAWSVHHLLDAPAEVAALRKELERELGDVAVPPSIEIANRLPYAGAVANEAMRLRPVAPLFFLEALVDTAVSDVSIPKGTSLVCLIRPPAVDPKNFGEPEVFRPARWIEPDATAGAHDASAHQPFGSGPRICPGRTLALLEMRLVLATLYQNFDVERVGKTDDVREIFAFAMMPDQMRVRLRPRARKTTSTTRDAYDQTSPSFGPQL